MSAALDLQGAIVAAIKASAPVSAIVADRVYDHVPRSPTTGVVTAAYPLVAISDWQELPDEADCIDGAEINVTIDAWSRAVGFPEVHKLAAAVKRALHKAELDLGDTALVMIEHDGTRTLRDPDGLTSHAVITFRALIETPA